MNRENTYAIQGCWTLFLKDTQNDLKEPRQVFWYKDDYYNWDECKKHGANMENFSMLHRRSIMYPISNVITRLREHYWNSIDLKWILSQYEEESVWKVQTIYGSTFIRRNKNKIEKKEILSEIGKRKRRIVGLIVTRKIGILGFKVASYI
jgi:hypothetical protein